MKTITISIFCLFILTHYTHGQNSWKKHQSNEHLLAVKKGSRTEDGFPGKSYWVNKAEYDLDVELDIINRKINGSGTIIYKNNSSDTLRYLVISSKQDIYKKGVMRDRMIPESQLTDGVRYNDITINGAPPVRTVSEGTNMALVLDPVKPLLPGESLTIKVDWACSIPVKGIRNGIYNDSLIFVGYWYPQIAVYDDIYGWDLGSHTGKTETYADLADFNVRVTVPADYLVWGTGDQTNEKEVYSASMLNRINRSRESEDIVNLLSLGDNPAIFNPKHNGVWEYSAKGVPDFAFAVGKGVNWDVTSCKQGEGSDRIWVNAVYLDSQVHFDKVADIGRKAIRYFVSEFPRVNFPFSKHITVSALAGGGGMEYPMMANNAPIGFIDATFELTSHEIAHSYFPFYINVNEKREAWLDEGITTLLGNKFCDFEGYPIPEKTMLNVITFFVQNAASSDNMPLIMNSYAIDPHKWFHHNYAKSSLAQTYLYQILSDLGIHDPLKRFMDTWKGKHPIGFDYLAFMESLSNRDLSWFIIPWYYDFNTPDLGLTGIKIIDDEAYVVIENKGGLPLPVNLTIQKIDGSLEKVFKGPLIWEKDTVVKIHLGNPADIDQVSLDYQSVPDVHIEDNVYQFSGNRLVGQS